MLFWIIIGQGLSTWAKITYGVIGGFTLIILTVIGVVLQRLGKPVNRTPDKQSGPIRNVKKHGLFSLCYLEICVLL